MVKVSLDVDESWAVMSFVVNRMLDEIEVDKSDRAKIRRWKTSDMRTTSEEMKALTEKLNSDLERLWEVRKKSDIRRPDWR